MTFPMDVVITEAEYLLTMRWLLGEAGRRLEVFSGFSLAGFFLRSRVVKNGVEFRSRTVFIGELRASLSALSNAMI